MKTIAALYFSFLLTTLLVLLFMKIGNRLGIMIDQPNSRKIHKEPIPRTGGPAIIIGALLPLIILYRGNEVILGLCLGSMCILVTGIIDDLWNINYKWKFVGQGLAATVTLLFSGIRIHTFGELWQGFSPDFGLLSLPLGIFFLVATTNMINLSDGLDGLAGGICFLIFSAVGFLAFFQTDWPDWRLITLCLCTLGAIAGFLRYNTHPATVFMGDTGSQFLGFLAGFSLLLLTQARTVYSPSIPLYLIGIPLIDTTLVIFERLRQGRPIFKADNNHIHHKLLRMGLRHSESVMVIYTLQLGMILIAWTGRYADNAVLFVSFLFLTGLSIYFFTLDSRITWVVKLPNNNSNPNSVKTGGIGSRILSREMAAKMTWYGLVCVLFLFYFVSPLLIESVPKLVGLFSFGMIVCLLLLNRLNNSYVSLFLMISFYFLGLYYIFFTEYSQNSFYTFFQYRLHYNILFSLLGMCYIGHLITTLKRISLTTNNFLMLTVVIFLFFLPKDYAWTDHFRSIAVKSFLILICLDLVFKRLKMNINFALPPAILALGLNALVAFLAFII
jgi:UDP-GlcNAc:undecaprenyl-phosphate GlcNAc-1-phosphate transferase